MSAAGFEVIKDLNDAQLQEVPVNALTASKGDLVERVAAALYWTACTSSSDHFTPKAILMKACTSSMTSCLAYRLTGLETVRAESANASNVSHNGDLMILTDENTVNNTGTTSAGQAVAFVQEGVSGASSEKRLIGRVLVGNGVDPDAA